MRTVFKVGGTILSALWTIVSHILTVVGVGTFLGYEIDWRWSTLGGFIIFLVFVGWLLGGLYRRINELQAQRPSIAVRPKNEFDNYHLEVKNTGNTATFQAEIEIVAGKEYIIPLGFRAKYKGCWETTRGRASQILRDHTDTLRIAYFVNNPPYISQHLQLYYYEPQSGQEGHFDSQSYLVGAKLTSVNGEEKQLTKPEFTLQVTISSVPDLKEGSFVKKYKLGLSGLEEFPN